MTENNQNTNPSNSQTRQEPQNVKARKWAEEQEFKRDYDPNWDHDYR